MPVQCLCGPVYSAVASRTRSTLEQTAGPGQRARAACALGLRRPRRGRVLSVLTATDYCKYTTSSRPGPAAPAVDMGTEWHGDIRVAARTVAESRMSA